MRLSTYVYAGQHERFAEDVTLPPTGQKIKVTLEDGITREGELVHAERVDAERLRITIEVPDAE